MKKNISILIPIIVGILAIAVFWIVSLTLTSVAVFIPGVIISYIVYMYTFYKNSSNSDKLLPLYLFALGLQFIHFTEEYLTNFTTELPKILDVEPYPIDYWLTFNMIAYFIFIVGGIALIKKIKELMIIPLFFILIGVLFNGIVHILLSIYVGGYFPGLYTALVFTVLGPVLVARLFYESKTIEPTK